MPYGDEKHNLIFQELTNMLGEENVRHGPATMTAYSRCLFAVATLNRARKPEFVVLPRDTQDVQRIAQLANRYEFPYSIMGSGVMMPLHSAAKRYWCIIDPKRMTKVEVDEKNMFVVVEPAVYFAQMHGETLKRGLIGCVPGGGGGTSVLANSLVNGMGLFN